MPGLKLIALSVLAFAVIACGGDDDAERPADGAGIETTPATSQGGAATTPAEGKPTQEAPPADVADEAVRFETSDGVVVQGHLYSTAGPMRKVVVLAHEFPRDQTAWTDFARELAGRGVHALTFDFRGYGETGGDRDIARIDLDLEAAVRFIGSRDYEQVYVFGASMGGTAALKVAARLDVAGVVTLSAPAEFRGLDARDDVAAVTEPKLFLAASGDGGAPDAVEYFMQSAPEPRQQAIYDGSEHGTELLGGDSGPDVKDALFAFLEGT